MAWITPIINWIASNAVTPTDFNRIEGNTLDLYTNKEDKSIVSTLATLVGTKVDKITGKGLSTNDYTNAEQTKLGGIAIGAQVNTVTTVAGRTGTVVVTKADVGLGSVENYAKASQAEAEAGTSDIKYMTPLRVKNATDKNIKKDYIGTGTWSGSVTVTHNLGRIPIVIFSGQGFIVSISTNTFSIQYDFTVASSGNYWYW